MMEAKTEKEQRKQQLLQLEARIKKLQIEEQRSKKRINDAKRQQMFVS